MVKFDLFKGSPCRLFLNLAITYHPDVNPTWRLLSLSSFFDFFSSKLKSPFAAGDI